MRDEQWLRRSPVTWVLLAWGCSQESTLGTPQDHEDASAPAVAEVEADLVYVAPEDLFCPTPNACNPGFAVDLEFNPAREGELWVVYRQPPASGDCARTGDQSGCEALKSKVAVITDAHTDASEVELKEDGNSWHFMRLVTALAFAENDSFATVGEARTGNWLDDPLDYMGPTWWSSDPEVFGIDFGLNGSHLDMLHATPFGMGIAHQPTSDGMEQPHVFWVFNGAIGALDRYDFNEPHEPGGEDHSDGTLHRFFEGELKRVEGVSSHMAFAPDRRTLLVVDSGHRRLVAYETPLWDDGDPMTQTDLVDAPGRSISTPDPQIADPRAVELGELRTLAKLPGWEVPSGLAVGGEQLFVGDAKTGKIHHLDLDGELLQVLETGFEPWSLAGLAWGPDQRLYLANWNEGSVYRVEVPEL